MSYRFGNSTSSRERNHTFLQRFGLNFYDRPKLTLLLWVLLVGFGILAYTTLLKREGFPAVNPPISSVSGTYFVNDQNKVDSDVTKPLSDIATKQPDIKTVNASSGNNFYFLQIEYQEGTDTATASKNLEEAVKRANILPRQTVAEFKPIIFSIDPEGQGDDLLLSFYSKQQTDAVALSAKANEAAAFLRAQEGLPEAERVRVMEQFRTGTNPVTNQTVTEQRAFDRIGVRNGEVNFYPSVGIAIKAKADIDDLKLYDSTVTALERLRADDAFNGYDVAISADYAEGIRAQIGSLQENLLGGLLAVLIVSFLLISLRASLVTALAMTTVIGVTLGILYVLGFTLNTIVLFSLILCLGLIVDDTTIMVEVIDAGRKSHKSRREIIAEAIRKVARASTAGTITTMLGFAPLLFIGGIIGEIVWAIPVTLIISLAVSLLISVTIVPFMGRFLIRDGKTGRQLTSLSPLRGVETFMSRTIARVILIGRRSRAKVAAVGSMAILMSIMLIIAGVLLFTQLKFNIFPATKDSDAIAVTMVFRPGTDIIAAQRITDEVTARTTDSLGNNLRRASLYSSGNERGARLQAQLVSYKVREVRAPELVDQLNAALDNYDQAEVKAEQIDVGPPPSPFGVRIYSDDSAKALVLAQDIEQFLHGRRLERVDGTTATVETSRIAYLGMVTRANGARYVEVQGTFDADDTTTLIALAQAAVEKEFPSERMGAYGLPRDVLKFDSGFETDNQESFQAMVVAFPILLVVMYLLLAVQFRSLLQPLLIFVAIPFSILGITGGLYLTDNPFSFFTMVGVFALIGISVNNTILLTDYANQGLKAGQGHIEAISNAVKARFRPLITTSLTAMVALIPLARSDPFWESLAVTLIFGLLASTLLVITAFPYYYLAAEFLRRRFSRRLTVLWLAVFAAIVTASGLIGINPILTAMPFLILTILAILAAFYNKLLMKRSVGRA